MKHLDYLELNATDIQTLDEIIRLKTGKSLAEETAHWQKRHHKIWIFSLLTLWLAITSLVWHYST